MKTIRVIGQLTTRKNTITLVSEERFEVPGILLPKGSSLIKVTRSTYDKMKTPRCCSVDIDKYGKKFIVVPLL